jgi:hypothetical protein
MLSLQVVRLRRRRLWRRREHHPSLRDPSARAFCRPGANIKYIVSQNVDVGDAPNHFVRLFHADNKVPNNAASINGLKLVDVFTRGTGELTDGHGGGSLYIVFVADNGDKLVSRNIWVAQGMPPNLTATSAGSIVSGTGKLANVQGTTHFVATFNPTPGGVVSNTQFDIEYSIGK